MFHLGNDARQSVIAVQYLGYLDTGLKVFGFQGGAPVRVLETRCDPAPVLTGCALCIVLVVSKLITGTAVDVLPKQFG